MRRKLAFRVAAGGCVFMLLLFAAAMLSACSDVTLPAPSLPSPVYTMNVTYDGERSVEVAQELVFTLCGDAEEIPLHLYPNAFSQRASSLPCLPEEKDDFYYNGESFGNIDVLNVVLNGKTTDTVISEDGGILTVPCDASAGDTLTLSLDALITLPECNARLGVAQDTVNLSTFYPVLCFYDGEEWRTDAYSAIGDPFLSDISTFYVTLTAPEEYVVAASGEVTRSVLRGEDRVTEISAENVRDFALFLSPDFERETAMAETARGDVTVTYFYISDEDASATAALAAQAVETFSAAFGDYPYSRFTLAEAEVGAAGMEYGTLATLSPALSAESREQTVVHETAHQWWFGVVGSDQIRTPWLDEGLTEFSAAYFRLLNGDTAAYAAAVSAARDYFSLYASLPSAIGFDGSLSRPASSFLTAGEYTAVVYCNGLLLFDTLLSLTGRAAFSAALADYFETCAFSVAAPSDLAAAFSRAGFDIRPVLAAYGA